MAEMAATQGYDLYSMSVNGKSLETALEFLLNAYQNPALLYQYSQSGRWGLFRRESRRPAGLLHRLLASREPIRSGLGGALYRTLSVFHDGSAAASDPGY